MLKKILNLPKAITRDLGLRLLALYLLFVLPLLGIGIYVERVTSERLISDIKSGDLALALAIARETNRSLGADLEAARTLGSDPSVIHADLKGMEQAFAAVARYRREVNLVYRLNRSGIMLYYYPQKQEYHSTLGVDFSFRDYYKRARKAREPFFSRGRISPTTRQPVVTAVEPLWSTDTPGGQPHFIGLVGINIQLSALSWSLSDIAKAHQPNEHFVLYILDSDDQIVASSNPKWLLMPVDEIAPQLHAYLTSENTTDQPGNCVCKANVRPPANNSTSQVDAEASQTDMLFTYAPIESAGWRVVVGRSAASAFATVHLFRRVFTITLIVLIVLGVLFWLSLATQVIRPLENLTEYSREIGESGEHPKQHRRALKKMQRRGDQVGLLARTLATMEAEIAARLHELHTLLETSAAVVSTLDSRTVLERILEQVERLLNIHKSTIIAWDEQKQAFVARASRGLSDFYATRLSIAPDEMDSLTLRALRIGHPLQISDTETDPTAGYLRPRARAEGYRSVLAVPLPTKHTPPAALVVYYAEPHKFTQREIDLLTSFANHAAMAIENAALFERSDTRLREQSRRLEALIQSMSEAVILAHPDGRVLYANRRAAELARLLPEDMNNAQIEQVLARILSQSPKPDTFTKKLLSAENATIEIELRQDQKRTYWQVHVFSVTDADNTLIGKGQIWKDVTADREVNRMKASLISTVSHELRTPLTNIKGYVTTLLADDVKWDPELQRRFLQTISDEADRLTELISDLLDLSRIESGSIKVNRQPIEPEMLKTLIERAARSARPSPTDRLKVNLPPDLPIIYADSRHIEVVLRNLLENAAKYGEKGTPITLSMEVEPGRVVFRVEDEGPGIPPEHIPYIFESFYRAESGLTQKASGLGLGLAICRGFVEAHGGEIWVEPRPHGTCIAFSLPLTPPPDTQPQG